MYKLSKFIKVVKKDKLFLINTISSKVFVLHKLDIIERILSNDFENLNDYEKKIINMLINENIVVEDTVKEEYIQELKYYEAIFDNTCNLTILPTEQCNFRCVYCYEKYNQGKMSQTTIDSVLKYITKNARKFSGINVSWFGGEPLLAIDVIENFSTQAMNIAKFYHIPYISSMTTNGYLLDYKTFEKLFEMKIVSYQITIDGTEEYHDKSRFTVNQDKSYRRIINNLLDIKNNAKNKHFNIIIRCNLTEESINGIDSFIEEMDYYFGGDKRFEFYFRPVGNWISKRIDDINILKSDSKILDKLLSNPKKLNYGSYYNFIFAQQCITSKRNNFVIRADGTISKCTVYLDESVIGKIDSQGKMDIDYHKLGKWVLPGETRNDCRECAFYGSCHGYSCPAKKISHSHEERADCGYEINSIDKIIELVMQSDHYNKTSNIILLEE
jgi:uncharacterized protein